MQTDIVQLLANIKSNIAAVEQGERSASVLNEIEADCNRQRTVCGSVSADRCRAKSRHCSPYGVLRRAYGPGPCAPAFPEAG